MFWPNHVATAVKNSIPGGHMSVFFSIPVVYVNNRGQFLIPYFIYFSRILDRGGTTWTGYFKCRKVKTGFFRKRWLRTGSSGTLIGWKSGQTLLSLHGTEWRDRGYGLRSGGGGILSMAKPNLTLYLTSNVNNERRNVLISFWKRNQNVLESFPNMSRREQVVLILTRICSPGLNRNVLFRWGRFGNKFRRFGLISC